MTSIEEARRAVKCASDQAVACATSERRQTFWAFERELWTVLLALGRALAALWLTRQAARPREAQYGHEGRRYQIAGERTSEVGTRFGKVAFTRATGRRVGQPRATVDLPVDRDLALCAGFSVGVVLALGRLCAQMAFANARSTFRDTYEWTPSPRATMRMVDALGDEARPFLEQAPPPADDGEVLVIQVDGKGAPMITDREHARRCRPHDTSPRGDRHARRARRRAAPRPRRTKGKKSKNAKVAVVGVLYTLRRTPEGLDGPIAKRLYATFASHEALFLWLRREADKRGYGHKQTLFVADGSEHIWRLQQIYFPAATPCLDWYHVVEKLWAAGECLYPEGSEELTVWMGEQTRRLRKGALRVLIETLGEALAEIPKTGPGNKGKRARLQAIITHLDKHRHRMRYDALRRDDLDIGSGAVEGAVRNLIGMRLDGPGMRWSRGRAERVLHLRCILLNEQWDDFTHYVGARHLSLASKPIPTQTHDAKAAA